MLSKKIMLLKIIKEKKDVSILLNRKVTYSEIAILLKQLEEEKNIEISSDNIKLTIKGFCLLEKYLSKSFSKKKDQWISPQNNKRKTQISIDKIVLPNKT